MMARKRTDPKPLTPDDLLFIQAVRQAEMNVAQQEQRVATVQAKLADERRELKSRLAHLRNTAQSLPLFENAAT